MLFYTGIGSREAPIEVLNLFINIGDYLARQGWVLRSGGADGADLAFEIGCDKSKGHKEIYVPWYRFNNSDSILFKIPQENFDLAKEYHPNWDRLSESAKKLHARNCSQILGKDLKTPTNLVICYTNKGKGGGGTGQALRVAKAYNIPIFDVGGYEDLNVFRRELLSFLKRVEQNERLM